MPPPPQSRLPSIPPGGRGVPLGSLALSDMGWPGNSWAGPRGPSKHLLCAGALRQGGRAPGLSAVVGAMVGRSSPAPLLRAARASEGTQPLCCGLGLHAPVHQAFFLGASVTPHSRLRPPSVGPSPRFSAEAQRVPGAPSPLGAEAALGWAVGRPGVQGTPSLDQAGGRRAGVLGAGAVLGEPSGRC